MYGLSMEEEVLKHLPLVDRVVNRLSIKAFEYERDDLFNIGVIGLIDAIQRFDPTKKVPFESYAAIRVRGAIFDEVRKNAKISRYKMDSVNLYYKAKQDLEHQLCREATDKEICEAMKITSKQLGEIYENIHFLASVSLEDTLFSGGDDGMTIQDTLQDEDAVNVEVRLLEEEQKGALTNAIRKLTEREQLVLSLYYKEELTLKEIAEILEVSIARISQIHGKVILKLKELVKEDGK